MGARLIELFGEEITWEILGSECRWYVTASHKGGMDPRDDFKFSAAEASIEDAVAKVAAQILEEGPAWATNQALV